MSMSQFRTSEERLAEKWLKGGKQPSRFHGYDNYLNQGFKGRI
jgi:hypothetical protein